MNLLNELKSKGWYLSEEGLETLKEGLENITLSGVIQKALNIDLREIGGNFLSEDLNKNKEDFVSGSGVVQIQKIKNASAPKYEYSAGAPPLLRLVLTDGNTFINCLQWGQWKSLNMDTPPGTKVYLKPGKIPMQNGFMLLSEHQFSMLGGRVASLIEKWELSKSLASHVRTKENLDGTGPPPWIPFGKPIETPKIKSGNFRALETETKEMKEDAVFKQQRLANIAEVSKVKEGKTKVFGGGKDIKQANNKSEANSHPQSVNSNDNPGYNKPYRNYDPDFRQSPRKEDDRNSRNSRTDRNFYGQDMQRNASFNENSSQGPTFSKDRRDDPRNKYNNMRNQGNYQNQRTFDNPQRENFDQTNHNRRYQKGSYFNENPHVSNNDRYSADRRSNDIEDISQRTSQIRFHGYDTQHDSRSVPTKPFLKPGAEVMAKYWEDNKFYRATVHAVGKEGKTCVVHFMEYGNYEEVLIDDVQQLQKSSNFKQNWTVGPISFQPSHWESYDKNQDFPPISNFQEGSQKSYGNHQDRHRSSRHDSRPSAKLYMPPQQRQTP